MPVVINSGSGNQGITVSMPVIEYARDMNASHDKLLRALIVSNLISIHQKRFLGSLSAYCGATSAACGAVCGIAYLCGYGYDTIANTHHQHHRHHRRHGMRRCQALLCGQDRVRAGRGIHGL